MWDPGGGPCLCAGHGSGDRVVTLVMEAVESYSLMLKDGFYNSNGIAFSTMLMLVLS